MPGYARYQKMAREIPTAVKSGALSVTWKDGQTFEYARAGKRYRYDVLAKSATEIGTAAESEPAAAADGAAGPSAAGRWTPRIARPEAEGLLPRPQPVAERRLPAATRSRSRRTAARRHASSTAPRAGCTARSCRRRPRCGGRPTAEARVLPVRREAGTRLSPPARSDQGAEHGRHRSLSEGRRAESRRRSVRVRRGREEDDADRRARRQAVRQLRGRPLRLPRRLVARRQRAAVQPHQPPAEHPRARRREPRDRRDARRPARGVADRLDREQPGHAVPEGRPARSSGNRSATAGRTCTSTI